MFIPGVQKVGIKSLLGVLLLWRIKPRLELLMELSGSDKQVPGTEQKALSLKAERFDPEGKEVQTPACCGSGAKHERHNVSRVSPTSLLLHGLVSA